MLHPNTLKFLKSLDKNNNREWFEKNKNLYAEGLISIDRTLNSFNAMLNANYNLITSKVSILLAQSKIDINNKIK